MLTKQEYQRKPWQFNVPIPSTPSYVPTTRVSWDDTKIYATSSVLNSTAPSGSSCLNSSLANGDAYYCTGSNHECCSGNDVVLIKVGTWFSTVKKRSSPLALNFLSAL